MSTCVISYRERNVELSIIIADRLFSPCQFCHFCPMYLEDLFLVDKHLGLLCSLD